MNPCGPAWLDQRLRDGRVVVIDGAMGTELESRGVPMNDRAWSGTGALTHPDIVKATHVDYIRAGAEVIITNTFASARHMLDGAGLGDRTAEINHASVAVALEARDEAAELPVAVAGSVCEWVHPDSGWTELDKLRESLREQVELLAESGVDLLAIEMGQHPDYAAIAVEEAVATGLPVWAGLSCAVVAESGRLGTFDPPHYPFSDLLDRIVEQPIGLINIMHSTIADTAAGLEAVKARWQGPVGIYPESGYFTMPNWQFVDIISPEDLTVEAHRWVEQGVGLVGGCCGLTIDHVRALREAFPR